MENFRRNKPSKCFLCDGIGLIKSNNPYNKENTYSYENRFKKYLLWIECPRCLGYGIDTKNSGSKEWDKHHYYMEE